MIKKTPAAKNAAPKKNMNEKTSSTQKTKLEAFFVDELKDIYWAEKHLTKALPKMRKAATSKDLANAFNEHLAVTKGHLTRLEKVFNLMGKKPQAKKCEAMAGISKECDSIIEDTEKGTFTRDAGLIFGAQKVEHYEIATYGTLAQFASNIGREDVANILAQTLGEEKDADKSLTQLALAHINADAEGEVEPKSKKK
jgi:ferritin-like metal-binding protein YciE